MPVLQFLENVAKNAVQLPVQFAENFSNTFANLGNRAAGRPDQTIQQNMGGQNGFSNVLNFSGATGTNLQLGTDIGQIGLATAAPAIGEAGAGALGLGDATGALGGAAKGAIGGASVGGTFNALNTTGQGNTSDKNLLMSFLEGTAAGGVLGAVGGAAGGKLSDVKAAKLAKMDDPAKIQKELTEDVGPVVANHVAPAVAQTDDPHIVKNVVENDINKKIPINQGPVPEGALGVHTLSPEGQHTIYVNDLGDNTTIIHELAHQRYSDMPYEQQGSLDYSLKQFNDKFPGAFQTTGNPEEDIAHAAEDYLSLKRQYGNKFTQPLVQVEGGPQLVKFLKSVNDDAANNIQKVPSPTPPPVGAEITPPSVSEPVNPGQGSGTNDLLNHFSNLRKQASSDEDFYNNTILENQETPGVVGQLSRSIARNVEGRGANITEELDNQLSPLTKDDLSGANTVDKEAQLNDLKQTARKLEKDTGQTGLYSNLAKNMANMSQDEQIDYLSKGLTNARDNGAMAAAHIGVTPSGPPEATTALGKGTQVPAMQEMQDIINRGGTVDEALNHHMEVTGSNLGEAQTALKQVIGAVGTEKGQINAKLNPEFGKLEIPTADTNERAILNSRMVRNQVTRAGNTALAEVDKLSPEDMSLLDQRGDPAALVDQAKDKAQFLRAANAVKKYNDTTQALGAGQLGQDVPYRQNYGAPLKFDRSTPEAEQAYQQAVLKLKTAPGYGKGRFFKNYNDAAELSNGQLHRQNENFLGDLYQDIQQRQNDLSQLTLAKGLEEANPGQVRIGQPGATENGVDAQLRIPGGNKIFMPQSIADEINKRAPAPAYSPTTGGAIMKGYDALNSNLKNLKLAGGGFHSINVLGSYVGQQLSSGKLFTPQGISDMGDVVKTTFSDKAFESTLSDMESRGKLTDADAAGLKFGTGETQADVSPSGKLGNIPVLKQIHSAIFDRQIPMLKLKLFDQLTTNLDRNNPDQLNQMTDIAQGLNKAFGGLNREVSGLTPQSFQRFSRVFLATDYNEGQLRTLGNAFTAGGAEGKLARQIVFGKALLFGGLATAGGAAGGEFQGKDAKQIAFDILQKVASPQFTAGGYKVGLPTTQIAEVAKPIEQTVTGVQSGHPLSGVQNFATNRLAAVPSEALQVAGNKNYIGQPLYGSDTHGRPISAGDTAANLASGVLPIPAAQAGQTATGNQSIPAAVANTVGLRVTAENNVANLPVEQQTYISTLQKGLTASGVATAQQKQAVDAITNFDAIIKQNSSLRNKVDTQINKDIAAGNMDKARADANAFNQRLYQAVQKAITPQTMQYLSIPVQGLKTPYEYLTGNTYGYFTNLNINGRRTTIKNNPTKFGLKIGEQVP